MYLRIHVLFLTLQCGILFMKYLVSFTNPGIINGAKKRQTWKQKGQWYSCTRIRKIESMFSSSFNRFRRLKNDIQCALNWKFCWKLWQKLTNPAKKVREDLLNNPVFRAKSSHPLSPGDRKWSTRRQYRPHLKARFVRPWWSGVIFWALPSTLPLTESTLHSHTKRKRSVVGKGSILRWLVVFDQDRVFFYSLRAADVSPRSSPLRDVSRGGASATQRQKFRPDDVKSVRNPVISADWTSE